MFFTDTVPRKTSWFWRHIVANAGPDIFAHMRRRHSRDGASPNVPFPDGPPNTSIPVAVRIEESENNELKIRWKVESEYGTKSKFDNVSRIRYQISVFHLLPTIFYKKNPFPMIGRRMSVTQQVIYCGLARHTAELCWWRAK